MARTSHPLKQLDDADLEFILQFVLASGSLKDLAEHYGVSYPTIRLRLDRVIMQVAEAAASRPVDPMSQLLARLVESGQIASPAAREVQKLYRSLTQRDAEK